jgi:hypothetical protein
MVVLWAIAWISRAVFAPWNWLRSLLPTQPREIQQPLRGCPGCAALIPRRAKICQYCQRILPMLALR